MKTLLTLLRTCRRGTAALWRVAAKTGPCISRPCALKPTLKVLDVDVQSVVAATVQLGHLVYCTLTARGTHDHGCAGEPSMPKASLDFHVFRLWQKPTRVLLALRSLSCYLGLQDVRRLLGLDWKV